MKDSLKNIIIGLLLGIVCILIVFIFLIMNGTISLNLNNDDDVENIKVYTSKDYVYDASYVYNNKYTEYGEGNEKFVVDRGITFEYNKGKQHLKDLKVPYININSNDANNINNVLKDLYVEMAKEFDSYAENAGNPFTASIVLTYKTYQYGNILSIVVISGVQESSPWNPRYYTYNFDLTNGDLLSFDEAINKIGYNNKEELLKKVESKIKDKMDELFGDFGDLTNSCRNNNGELINCYDVAIGNFNYTIENDNINYFISNDGNLSVFFVPGYSNAESGNWTYLVVIK